MSILQDTGGVDVFGDRTSTGTVGDRSPDLDSLIGRIYVIDSREDIEAISEAVRIRRRELRDRAVTLMKRSLTPGETVRFVDTIRPAYLAGLTASVVKVNRTKAVLSTPDESAYGRFRGARSMTCPLSLLEAE